MDAQVSKQPPMPIAVPMDLTKDDAAVIDQRGSAVRHLAILSTLLVPIAFLPYMMTRRRVTALSRKIDAIGGTAALRRGQAPGQGAESESGALLLVRMRQEMDAMRQQLETRESKRTKHIMEELDKLKGDVPTPGNASNPRLESLEAGLRNLEDGMGSLGQQMGAHASDVQEQIRLLRGQQEALRSELFKLSDEVQNSELQKLLSETKQTRAIFGAIGSSLGDVATIIQRVEIEMGHDSQRSAGYDPVERLRVLGLQMQDQTAFREEKGKDPRRGRA
ncbi:hypothetical protein C8R46DRAFT_1073574 [Mycena filopes]|nr:hypothetical protein C8R46DRAFT_1073574 [Mycena filopes]